MKLNKILKSILFLFLLIIGGCEKTELPSEELEAWPVFSIRTTKTRSDGKLKNEPFEWEGLPELGNDNPLPDKQKSLF